MSWIFIFIVVMLAILAIFDIIVGVANDAVNFLQSALGARIATTRVIVSVAAVGILVGVLTSSGMMEVARSGVFHPAQFSFPEVMALFLAMLIGDILLLDIFNSLGLPTSTTVSLVFGLLGAAVGVSLHHIALDPELTVMNLSQFINSAKAMAMIGAILLSVVLSFLFGSLFMYLSRLLFSFRYQPMFRRLGALWCGISLCGIIYFVVFKGLKSSGLIPVEVTEFIHNNTLLSLTMIWAASSLLLFVIQRLGGNIMRITILAGTFSLALAFAGNDLVNFIGVSLAGFDSFRLAQEAGTEAIMMGGLAEPVKAPFVLLLAAGLVMVLTLFFNKKAMKVAEVSLSLSSQNEGEEQFGSTMASRGIVRSAVALSNLYDRVMPRRLREAIDRRFEQLPEAERGNVTYDLIRAVVNMSAASILISLATSLKLPLSTTYVVFMVAMGSSLADRAWGRESAVYRITGVFTVIAGWFVTALGAFTIALCTSSILVWGGKVAVVMLSMVALGIILYRFLKPEKEQKSAEQEDSILMKNDQSEVLYACTEEVIETMRRVNRIYNRTMVATFKENRKLLKEMTEEAKELLLTARSRKYQLLSTLQHLRSCNVHTGHFYVQVVDYMSEVTKALYHVVKPCYEHIDNHHEGLSKSQISDLMTINDDVEEIFRVVDEMLKSRNFEGLDGVMEMRDRSFDRIALVTKAQIQRINDEQVKTPTRASLLFLDILAETKTMILQARNLVKSQSYFINN